MHASMSLTSIFSSFRSQPLPSSPTLIPIIRIIKPSEPPPNRLSDHFPSGIRRWRGALGAMGDFSLQLPSRGLTRGARLALARQGCATGSFRLNCSESLHAVDTQGRALYEKIELGEELETAVLGLREKPPLRSPDGGKVDAGCDLAFATAAPGKRVSSDSFYPSSHKAPLRKRGRDRKVVGSQKMQYSSFGLSSCATFTEGLCSLEEYMQPDDSAESSQREPCIKPSFSADSVPVPAQAVQGVSENDYLILSALAWLKLLRKTNGCKEASSKNATLASLSKSLTCLDLRRIVSSSIRSTAPLHRSGSDFTLSVKSPAPDASDLASARRLPRDSSSWSKLCHKFVNKSRRRSSLEISQVDSFGVASGLFAILQSGILVTTQTETHAP